MVMKSPFARGGALAACAGAAGLVMFGVTPSTAQADLRAAFERLDADANGQVTLEEFSGPGAAGGGGLMLLRSERIEEEPGAEPREEAFELWLPAVAPPGGTPGEPRQVRIEREVEGDNVVHEEIIGPAPGLNAVQERMFARFDGDADGAVSFEEYEARVMAMVSSSFGRLDADADGRIAPEEFTMAAVGLPSMPAGSGLPDPISADSFTRLDSDGDGALTLDEFAGGGSAR